jgi:hypothetical protein
MTSAATPGREEQLALASKLDGARWAKITHGVNVSLSHQEMDLARDALRLAAKPAEETQRQLDRANKIIAWMMPYIGTMCPPQNGLGELSDHCFENNVCPNFDDETKGRPINQSGILPNTAALSTGEPKR